MVKTTLKLTPIDFDVACPECKLSIPSPGGSLFWTQTEIDLAKASPVTCTECKRSYRFPTKA